MSGWDFRWSEGRPETPGVYLLCWLSPNEDKWPTDYEMHQWDGKHWTTFRPNQVLPTHWQKITSPALDILKMKEYENATR